MKEYKEHSEIKFICENCGLRLTKKQIQKHDCEYIPMFMIGGLIINRPEKETTKSIDKAVKNLIDTCVKEGRANWC